MTTSNPIPQLSALQWPGGLRPVEPRPVRTFVRSPGFDTFHEAADWLRDQRCSVRRIERGPDGLYRGSGEVTRG